MVTYLPWNFYAEKPSGQARRLRVFVGTTLGPCFSSVASWGILVRSGGWFGFWGIGSWLIGEQGCLGGVWVGVGQLALVWGGASLLDGSWSSQPVSIGVVGSAGDG